MSSRLIGSRLAIGLRAKCYGERTVEIVGKIPLNECFDNAVV